MNLLYNFLRILNSAQNPSPVVHLIEISAMCDYQKDIVQFYNSPHELNSKVEQVAFQSNANHPLAESMGYIKYEGM